MTYLKVGDGVWVNTEQAIDYDVSPFGVVDLFGRPAWIGRMDRGKLQPAFTMRKGDGGADVKIKIACTKAWDENSLLREVEQIQHFCDGSTSVGNFATNYESPTELVNRVAAEQREGKA